MAILSAVLAVATVTATNDYSKDQQFRALNKVKEDIAVTVRPPITQPHIHPRPRSEPPPSPSPPSSLLSCRCVVTTG